jgi:hypothetical protein
MNESTTMHGPAANAPTVSNKVGHCRVCKTQWQILSTQSPYDDAKGCSFCGSDRTAITIIDESPDRR